MSGDAALRRWWVSKYRRPTTDPLFQGQSREALILEWYEDLWSELRDLERVLAESQDVGATRAAEKRYASLCEVLDVARRVGDPLSDWWEREVAAGRSPDLEMTVEDLPAWWRSRYGSAVDDG